METITGKGWFTYCLSALMNDDDISANEYCRYSAEEIVDALRSAQNVGFAKEIEPDGEVRMWEILHPDLGKITFNSSRFTEISINDKKVITVEDGHNSSTVMGVFNWIPGKNRIKNAAFLTHDVSEYYIINRFEGWPEVS
jgi:hypothetical protein